MRLGGRQKRSRHFRRKLRRTAMRPDQERSVGPHSGSDPSVTARLHTSWTRHFWYSVSYLPSRVLQHGRQYTGRPCVGSNAANVVFFRHAPHVPENQARFPRQGQHRGFLVVSSSTNLCSPTLNTKFAALSARADFVLKARGGLVERPSTRGAITRTRSVRFVGEPCRYCDPRPLRLSVTPSSRNLCSRYFARAKRRFVGALFFGENCHPSLILLGCAILRVPQASEKPGSASSAKRRAAPTICSVQTDRSRSHPTR